MEALLGSRPWAERIYSNGWRAGRGRRLDVLEPATGELLCTAASAGAEDVGDAAIRAAQAQVGWSLTAPAARGQVLRRCAEILLQHLPEIQGWLVRESGSTCRKAEWEIRGAAADFVNAAALTHEACGSLLAPREVGQWSMARRTALGVVGVITPWNSPLVLASRVLAPALAMGNAVILKPDIQTPVSGGAVLAQAMERAGLPEGLLHVLAGAADVGEALCSCPGVAKISFTGSTSTGRRVAALAGEHLKRVSLELGGNNAYIVLEDADVEAAAKAGAFGSFFHQGQVCFSIGRHLVHASVYDAYVEALCRGAVELAVGNPVDPGTQVGPLINSRQLNRVHGIVQRSVQAGARLVTGGRHEALFYRPTVLADVTESMDAFTQEIFGPVAPVTRVSSTEEAIRLAQASPYGLAAAVQTRDIARGLAIADRLRVGIVHVNDQTIVRGGDAPVGGEGDSGNGGRAGHLVNADEWSAWQWLTMRGNGAAHGW